MINEKDLRVGNYVTSEDENDIYVVNDDVDTQKDIERVSEIGSNYCNIFCDGNYNSASYFMDIKNENLYPIALNEKWLLKFGFENIDDNEFYRHPDLPIIQFMIEGVNIDPFMNDGSQLKSIQFVHQLQNLYFVLSGEELTIKI